MKYFTVNNTDGFSSANLDVLNQAANQILGDTDDAETIKNTCNRLGNEWQDDITASQLVSKLMVI